MDYLKWVISHSSVFTLACQRTAGERTSHHKVLNRPLNRSDQHSPFHIYFTAVRLKYFPWEYK